MPSRSDDWRTVSAIRRQGPRGPLVERHDPDVAGRNLVAWTAHLVGATVRPAIRSSFVMIDSFGGGGGGCC